MDDKLHYRLFAKLLLFVTLLLGGFIGYVTGLAMGKQQTLELIQEGRQIERTTATGTADRTTASSLSADQLTCYRALLGNDQYVKYLAGGSLTATQAARVATCPTTSTTAPAATSSPTVTVTATPAQ